MEIICPIHQFEIRYSNILNFPLIIREAIAPFVKLASRIGIDNENSHSERITLFFDEQYYQIVILWDRIYIKVENNGYFSLNENNSIIEEPFLNLFSKISEMKGFGEIKNCLFFSIFVHPKKDNLDIVIKDFTEKYFTKNSLSLLPNYSDIGISVEKNDDRSQIFLNFGPYIGADDLKKKNIVIKNTELLKELECTGEMLEYKYFENNKNVHFKLYKNIFQKQDEYIKRLWK
ncbi:MAG: hypothetical protein U9R42_06000 [Bacteroidota bacterium]|nr:hypothetical protein [Bacteroidota bacterium]